MSRIIHELDQRERENLIDSIHDLVPDHAHWLDNTVTWSTPKGMWSIEINFQFDRYTLRQGTENKWVRFDDDMVWLRQILTLMEAFG